MEILGTVLAVMELLCTTPQALTNISILLLERSSCYTDFQVLGYVVGAKEYGMIVKWDPKCAVLTLGDEKCRDCGQSVNILFSEIGQNAGVTTMSGILGEMFIMLYSLPRESIIFCSCPQRIFKWI